MLQRYMTVAELHERTLLPRTTIYDAISDGSLPALRPGDRRRGLRIGERDAEEWLERETRRGTGWQAGGPASETGAHAGHGTEHSR